MSESIPGKQTVLYQTHLSLNAKMEPFGGFSMPIQYEGIIKEHKATRESATLFDTCHMGKIRVSGTTACADLENILSCKISTLKIGQCRYGFICNESGGVLDDQIVYRISEHKFIVVINAGTQQSDFKWIRKHCAETTTMTDISDITAKIDLQGPASPKILAALLDEPIVDLKYFHFIYRAYKNTSMLISRTGYTGEIGFEIFCPHDLAVDFWHDCMDQGASPAGLGCRDTLRLEMGYPLYGHELDIHHNPLASQYPWAIASDKTFIGSNAIPAREKLTSLLVGITLDDRRAARHGDTILNGKNAPIGTVTSGSYSPSLERAIALGYVDTAYASIGTRLVIKNQRQKMGATVCELPFYTNGSARQSLSDFL